MLPSETVLRLNRGLSPRMSIQSRSSTSADYSLFGWDYNKSPPVRQGKPGNYIVF